MAHEIENMFSVRETPWHGLGRILPESPDWDNVLTLAGLNWQVSARTLQTFTPDGRPLSVPTHRAIVRDFDDSILSVLTKDYKIVQNDELLNVARPLHDAGAVRWETAGSLAGGKRVWFLGRIKLDPVEIVPGDPVCAFLLLSNSHDGSLAVRIGWTPIRVVCANTLALAHSDGASRFLALRHSEGVHTAMEAISAGLDAGRRAFQVTAEQYRAIAKVHLTGDMLPEYVRAVYTPRAKPEEATPPRILETIERLVEEGRGTNLPGVKGTLWAAYNAVTEHLAYERGNDRDKRLDANWFGASAVINRRALDVAVSMVG